jgi:class 3 adenylate cyclase
MRKSIGLKILSVALVMMALMAVVTGISSWHLDAVSDEAVELAHYYIPIQQRAHLAARYSTSELLHLERYIALKHAGAPAERLKAEQAEMERYSRLVDVMIVQSLAKVDEGDKDKEINISSPMYEQLRIELPQISAAHGQMAKTVQQYLKESDSGDPRQAIAYETLLTEQRQDVAKEINDVTVLLDKLTEDSSESALALEDKARKFTWAVTAGAAVVGLLLAFLITRALVRPVRELVAGTLAVQGGNLNVNLKVQSTDEIGSLTSSFNQMIGGLKQKEVIQNTFGKYVDPRIVKNLIENEGFAQQGEKRVMTVFFSDIKGFTSICEKLPPDELVRFLNRYFTLMSGPIRAENGIIDKYIGDSIMAFWGPPFVEPALHPLAACRAAVAQMKLMDEFRRELPSLATSLPPALEVNMRIGISTGEVTVGNIGSDASKGYTVVGDTVNLAARLESAGKQYGTNIIISEETWAHARDGLDTRELDRIRVVGKNEPVRIFEVIGLKGEADARRCELTGRFEAALRDFRGGSIGEARQGFETSLDLFPGDRPCQVFLDRITLLERAGLPSGWDGVWTLKDK